MLHTAALLLCLQAPDTAELERAGARTLEKLAASSASWTMLHRLENGAVVHVHVLHSRGRRRSILKIQGTELCRIIARDGAWYRLELERAGKYRPFEAPTLLPTTYLFLTRSDPRVVTRETLADARHQKTERGVALYRLPLAADVRSLLESTLKQMDDLGLPDRDGNAAKIRDLLKNGSPLRVEVASGLVLETGSKKLTLELTDMRWLDKVDDGEFDVAGRKWEDHTGDPTAGDRDELVMLGCSGMWRPGANIGDTELCLVNLKTGDIRRVPFQGGTAMGVCFTKDRTKAIVSGLTEEGALLPFEVDLKTGENRPLAGGPGFWLMGALSPDGKQIVMLHKDAAAGILESHVTVIDLETLAAKRIGKPMDTAFLSWPGDGKGLLLIRRTNVGMDKPAIPTICRLDMSGTLTDVRPGDEPVALDGKTILFMDRDTSQWKTCGLDGRNEALFADGAPGHILPATVSPDGRRVMMLKARPGKEPWVVIFKVGEKESRRAFEADGLWLHPIWR